MSPPSAQQFALRLVESALFTKAELNEFIKALPQRPADARALAAELLKAGRLTRFQAETLYRGEGRPLVLGNYVILDRLGAGGMGEVYRAEHRRMERIVALKVLPPSVAEKPASAKRFEREAKAAARLSHPNVVTAHDCDQCGRTLFLVMEYVPGDDLASLVRKKGPLPLRQAVDCVVQAARGLEYAHARGVVHRDIKPANLLLDEGGTVKVLDLGLARIGTGEDDAPAEDGLTATGTVMGTVDYMAPEQALDAKHADHRADVYALGCTLYFLLTARPVYGGDTLIQKVLAHRDEPVPSLRQSRPEVPAALETVFARMVAKDSKERYQSMTEVIAALEASLETTVIGEPPPAEPPFSIGVTATGGDELQSFLRGLESGGPGPGLQTVRALPNQAPATIQPSPAETAISTVAERTLPSLRPMPQLRPTARKTPPDRKLIWAAVAGLSALAILLGVVFRVDTPAGTVVLDFDQPDLAGAEVSVDGEKKITLKTGQGRETIEIEADQKTHTLKVSKGGFATFTKDFTVDAGTPRAIRVRLEPAKAAPAKHPTAEHPTPAVADGPAVAAKASAWQPTPEQQAFFEAVAVLPAEEQVKAVAARMKAVNSSFDGKLKHEIKDGRVVGFDLSGNGGVKELWPLAALVGLESLNVSGTEVESLAPLSRLRALTSLDTRDTWARDLAPLAGLPLTTLQTFVISVYNEPAMAVLRTLPKLETVNGVPLDRFLGRRDELEQFRQEISGLKADKQLERVVEKLKEFNPGFDGKLYSSKIRGGRVVAISLMNVKPISDLSPLAGLPLEELDCGHTGVCDLSPLKGTPLTRLRCAAAGVCDLSPLVGMRLTYLHCNEGGDHVSDLSALEGMPLTNLYIAGPFSDLAPLRGMPLRTLECWGSTIVSDLSPLRELPLTYLVISSSRVSDLTPLQGRQLTYLNLPNAAVSDLSPLRRMPLRKFSCARIRSSDLSALKGAPLEELAIPRAPVSDLSLLKGTPLRYLECQGTLVSDLSPLKGAPLKYLDCGHTLVSDLSPLRGMPLEALYCRGTSVTDISPLEGMPLKTLTAMIASRYDEAALRVLRTLPELETVNDLPPDAFFRLRSELDELKESLREQSPEKQLEVVSRLLKELNPRFDGTLPDHRIEAGQVTMVSLAGERSVSDISPLGLLPLTVLNCSGTGVIDLLPLQGMPLNQLNCSGTRVADLSPLKGMPLTSLDCRSTRVTDLSPLQGMNLVSLELWGTRVRDISPLKGMPLKSLTCANTLVNDLSPVKELPLLDELYVDIPLFDPSSEILLRSLHLSKLDSIWGSWRGSWQPGQPAAEHWKMVETRRKDAEAFAAETMKLPLNEQVSAVETRLKQLNNERIGPLEKEIEGEAVTAAKLSLFANPDFIASTRDLTPLRAFSRLKRLTLVGGSYRLDLSPLNSLPLEELTCIEEMAFRNAPVLRAMPTLKTINGEPAGEYLDGLTAKYLRPVAKE